MHMNSEPGCYITLQKYFVYEILPEDFYQHHLLLVDVTYLSLQDFKKADDVQKSSLILQ